MSTCCERVLQWPEKVLAARLMNLATLARVHVLSGTTAFLGSNQGDEPSPLTPHTKKEPNGTFLYGGERGIRTLEGFNTLHAFQACAIDHSATSPKDGGNPSSLTQSPTSLLPLLPSRPGGVHNMSPSGDQDGSPLRCEMLKEMLINSYSGWSFSRVFAAQL